MARTALIAPLTGVRLVAAAWVVLFHVYLFNGADLSAAYPAVDAVVGPVVSQGDLGVDLFFLLSGFVLAHHYLERLGSRPSFAGAVDFLWLRVARVWPLYMLAVIGGGLLLSLRLHVWGTSPNVPLSVPRFLAQVFMVQQWGAAEVPDTSWTGPAWSISAEWLAYLSFPVLAVVVWRLRTVAGPRALLGLAGLALVPTLVWTAVAQTQAAPYMWLARLASEFTCGALLSAAVARDATLPRRTAGRLTAVVVAASAGWLYLVALAGRPWLGPLVVAAFPALVLGLAQGDGPLHRWLGSRPMVVGGGASFALYLVHVPLLKLFRDALDHGALPFGRQWQLPGELTVVALSLVLAWALFRHVEEPARHRLRGLGPRLAALPPARVVRAPLTSPHGTHYWAQQSALRTI